jgi:hypothetical protein
MPAIRTPNVNAGAFLTSRRFTVAQLFMPRRFKVAQWLEN